MNKRAIREGDVHGEAAGSLNIAGALRLCIVSSHPVQYHTPLYNALSGMENVQLHVLYAHKPTAQQQGVGFGQAFQWDVDLFSGYAHTFLNNTAKQPTQAKFFGCNTPGIFNYLSAARPSAVIIMGWQVFAYWQTALACAALRIPLFVRSDSQLGHSSGNLDDGANNEGACVRHPLKILRGCVLKGMKKLCKGALYPLVLPQFSAAIPYGARSLAYLKTYGVQRAAISPHFINNAWFTAQAQALAPQKEELLRAWGLQPGAFTFLFAGKFEAKKRPLDILKALHALHKKGISAQLLMVGTGPLLETCKAYVQANSLQAHVHFSGFLNQSEMPRAYAVANCLVLASSAGETWGLVVNEAFASGVPAIVSSACGCAEEFYMQGFGESKQLPGSVYPVGDVRALTRAMQGMAGNVAHHKACAQAAKQRVQAFSPQVAARSLVGAIGQFM